MENFLPANTPQNPTHSPPTSISTFFGSISLVEQIVATFSSSVSADSACLSFTLWAID